MHTAFGTIARRWRSVRPIVESEHEEANAMTTVPSQERRSRKPFYIESDGKPVGETPRHVRNMIYVFEPLKVWFADEPDVYIGANMFVHYERGNRNRHVSPDVFVVKGVPKGPERRNYLVWVEGKGPDAVIELTSESTRDEDLQEKMTLYRDVLRVKEYFLFDPYGEYLDPPLQGYGLGRKHYRPILPAKGRLPSQVLGLHLEADGELLRLYDPATNKWLPTPPEVEEARRRAEAELDRLRKELEALRRRRSDC
jgi:Uma2 family endonuclease